MVIEPAEDQAVPRPNARDHAPAMRLQTKTAGAQQRLTRQFTFDRVSYIHESGSIHDFPGAQLRPVLCTFVHPSAVVTNTCS